MSKFKNHEKRKELEIFETKIILLFFISFLLLIFFDYIIVKVIGIVIMIYSYTTFLFGSRIYSENSIEEDFKNIGKECSSNCKYCKKDKERLLEYEKEQKIIKFVNTHINMIIHKLNNLF